MFFFGPVGSSMVPYGPVWSFMVLSGLDWSFEFHLVLHGPVVEVLEM